MIINHVCSAIYCDRCVATMFFWKFFEEYEKADHMTDYKTHISMFLIVISQLSICGSFFEKYNKPII